MGWWLKEASARPRERSININKSVVKHFGNVWGWSKIPTAGGFEQQVVVQVDLSATVERDAGQIKHVV